MEVQNYALSWRDESFLPNLNESTVLIYFCTASNPFYDKTCNNEVIKMQRLDPTHLDYMTGIEYVVHNSQEPYLYVIKKAKRNSPVSSINFYNKATPLAYYYILNGTIYQCPDAFVYIRNKMLSSLYFLKKAFSEMCDIKKNIPQHPSSEEPEKQLSCLSSKVNSILHNLSTESSQKPPK